MKVCVDLFSGLGGSSEAFVKAGWEVVRIDVERRFRPTIQADAAHLPLISKLRPRVILLSPPCHAFSVASLRIYWRRGRPNAEAWRQRELTMAAIREAQDLKPDYWILENPLGMMKYVLGPPVRKITLCQYGARWKKPTGLWGNVPPSFRARRCRNGDPCHEAAPRGVKGRGKGVQGSARKPEERAKLPFGLSKEFLRAVS